MDAPGRLVLAPLKIKVFRFFLDTFGKVVGLSGPNATAGETYTQNEFRNFGSNADKLGNSTCIFHPIWIKHGIGANHETSPIKPTMRPLD